MTMSYNKKKQTNIWITYKKYKQMSDYYLYMKYRGSKMRHAMVTLYLINILWQGIMVILYKILQISFLTLARFYGYIYTGMTHNI